ncbi:MAG: nucleotidyltransferase family protein [Candidatus Thiodiazotropha sp.]|jgi:molybdenum cofactor cytidylyltransferase
MTAIVGVLLAAGRGERFGGNKLMAPMDDGARVAPAAARRLVQVVPESIAVVRLQDKLLKQALNEVPIRLVENPYPGAGLGDSLALGVRASAGAAGWLIALGDMPWVELRTLEALVRRLESGASLVAPVYRGQRGHPVGFAAEWGGRLSGLSGEAGARHLLKAEARRLELVPCGDPGVLRDVDFPADLERGRDTI